MKRGSLIARLLAATTIALIATATPIAILSYVLITHFPQVLLEADLTGNADEIAEGLVFDAHDKPVGLNVSPGLASIYDALKDDVLYLVVDLQGNVLRASDDIAHALTPVGQGFDPALERFDVPRRGRVLHVATFPLERPGPQYYLQIARSERFQVTLMHHDSDTALVTAVAAVLLALLVFSTIVVCTFRRMLKPLHDVSQAASKIAPGNLDTRLSTKDIPSELMPLITALNEALERLALGYRVQQAFLTTAAHELKTPLALMRGTVELGNSTDRATLLADIDGMSRQVQQLLQLAECSDLQNYTMAPTDVACVVNDTIAKLERLVNSADVTITTTQSSEVSVITADYAAMFILVRNLLENAVQHAPRGSTVEVAYSQQGLSVRDYGPGIHARDLPMLFRRYWRGVTAKAGGSGLGLSICLQVAQTHGWRISTQPVDSGACFFVAFHPAQGSVLKSE